MDKLRRKSESLEREIRDQSKFKDFYQFTFSFAKNPGQKGLGNKTAVISCTTLSYFVTLYRVGNGCRLLEHCVERKVQVSGFVVYFSTGNS